MPCGVSRRRVDAPGPPALRGPTAQGGTQNPPTELPARSPIVLVPGFGAPSIDSGADQEQCSGRTRNAFYNYWGQAAKLGSDASPVLCTWPSGLGSLHDRACEVFYQLKGGRVDYGLSHSEEFGHERYGREYAGLFPDWSAERPAHLVGHSLGGTTARMLQHLLHTGFFEGHATSSAWVVSLTTINSPLNGSPQAYALGEREDNPPDVVVLSPGWLLGRVVHVAGFLGVRPMGYDLGMDHWKLSLWHAPSKAAALRTLLRALVGRSELVEDRDNAAYDCCIHAMKGWNDEMGPGHAGTFYISFVGDSADANTTPARPEEGLGISPAAWASYAWCILLFVFRRCLLGVIALLARVRSFERLRPYDGFDIDTWRGETDGLCPVYTQSHPRECGAVAAEMPESVGEMRPGVWHVERHGQDHMGIVPFPVSEAAQRSFFARLYTRLRALPDLSRVRCAGDEAAGAARCGLTALAMKDLVRRYESDMSDAETLSAASVSGGSPGGRGVLSRATSERSLPQLEDIHAEREVWGQGHVAPR